MKGHGAKFGRKKEEAIAALLSHRSVEEAARAIQIDPNTLLRWLQLPAFRKAYLKARREVVQQAAGASGTVALKLMTDPNVPAAVRLRAAEFVFDRAIKGIEINDIEARVSDLERAADKAAVGKRGRLPAD
jgi:transposase-like protein